MKRQFLALAAGMAALLGANQPTATTTAKASPDLTAQRTDSTSRAPQAPEQPATAQASRPMRFKARPHVALGGPVHFIEKQGPRRVKYGKSRWVVLS